MMPFLHEGSNSVTITPTNGVGNVKSKSEVVPKLKQEPGRSLGGNFQKTVKTSVGVPSVEELQRKAAQRKLQMAKMMGHGGGLTGHMDFRKPQGHMSMMPHYDNDAIHAASRRARSNNFTLNETFALLKIWASPQMQWQMKHNFRNFRVWEAISFAMQELGHDRTAIQCKNRIQNLTSIFYRIKKSKQDYRSFNFPYYKIIGDVLDGKKNGSNATMPPDMAEFIQHFSSSGVGIVNQSQSGSGGMGSSGMAAHMALVEEYQHLINGNPEVTLTPTGDRNGSPGGGSSGGMNVLSPEVSISEGDSPIRMDMRSGSSQSPGTSAQKNAGSDANTPGRSSTMNGNSSHKMEREEGAADDGSVPSENDHEVSDFDESNMYNQEDETLAMLGRAENFTSLSSLRGKRNMSTGFGGFGKTGYNGIPSKRPRGLSSATTTSTGAMEDPIGQYLSEMVEIERQWLDMERERAENERQMMMYMMQILQALVCPEQEQEEGNEDGTAEEGNENEAEATENEEYAENENDDSEIREMIEQEENTGSQ